MKTPVLETERLILRPISLGDAPAIQKHFNNWNIIKNLTTAVPWPYPPDGAEVFLRETALPLMESGGALVWAITMKADSDELIGIINYRLKTDEHGDNRGFWLAEHLWRKGYTTEAVEAVNDYVFFELNVESFIVGNVQGNEGSRRVKEKTGARYLGLSDIEHHAGNVSEKWEMTRENWAKIRGRV